MVAKMVSSLPTSTFIPGLIRVPRWRMMILPERTCSPAYFFTPRRCAFESLPLRLEPPPFLCAMLSSLSYFFAAEGFFVAVFLAAGLGLALVGFFSAVLVGVALPFEAEAFSALAGTFAA